MGKPLYSLTGKKIWVAGHAGMVGSALCRMLEQEECQILTVSRRDLDLRQQADVQDWLHLHRPDAVFLAAATVGGIQANNTRPAEFIYDNLMIESNIIHGAYKASCEKLLFLGSSCIYPKFSDQPIAEEALLTGALEPTNEMYALAKIAGIKMCQAYRKQYGCDFISAMPTNLYGPHDNYHPVHSHVIPGLIRRIHEARMKGLDTVDIWGTGTPRREFLYVDDLAQALVFMMKHYSDDAHLNVGTGEDIAIKDLVRMIFEVTGYDGALSFDTSKPDGTPRKLLNIEKIKALGWSPRTSLEDGLKSAYDWYLHNIAL